MAVRTKPADVAAGRRGGRRFGSLLGLVVVAGVISAFASSPWVRVLQTVLFLVAVLIAVRTSRASRPVRRLANVIVLGGSVVALALTRTAPNGPAAGAGFTWIALMLLLAVILILERVLTSSKVTLQSIFGAISAYMIIGLMFGAVYGAIASFGGGSFFANGQPGTTATFQYFSFVTLTTVGYGDFTAAAAGGRAVAAMEALLGQVFLAVLIGWLVSVFRAPRFNQGDARPRPPARPAARRRGAGTGTAAKRPYRPRPARPGSSTGNRRSLRGKSPARSSSGGDDHGGRGWQPQMRGGSKPPVDDLAAGPGAVHRQLRRDEHECRD